MKTFVTDTLGLILLIWSIPVVIIVIAAPIMLLARFVIDAVSRLL